MKKLSRVGGEIFCTFMQITMMDYKHMHVSVCINTKYKIQNYLTESLLYAAHYGLGKEPRQMPFDDAQPGTYKGTLHQ